MLVLKRSGLLYYTIDQRQGTSWWPNAQEKKARGEIFRLLLMEIMYYPGVCT